MAFAQQNAAISSTSELGRQRIRTRARPAATEGRRRVQRGGAAAVRGDEAQGRPGEEDQVVRSAITAPRLTPPIANVAAVVVSDMTCLAVVAMTPRQFGTLVAERQNRALQVEAPRLRPRGGRTPGAGPGYRRSSSARAPGVGRGGRDSRGRPRSGRAAGCSEQSSIVDNCRRSTSVQRHVAPGSGTGEIFSTRSGECPAA